MARRVNSELLRKYLQTKGDFGKSQLSIDAKISVSMIEKMMVDAYSHVPREVTRDRICAATGLKEEALFPFVVKAKTSRAS